MGDATCGSVVVMLHINVFSEVGKYIFPPFCNIIDALGGAVHHNSLSAWNSWYKEIWR